jgi:hypothetical protein
MKEHLLEVRQIPIRVCNLPKKLTTRDKTKPLGSQRVGFDNEQPRVEMNYKCRNDQCPTSQKCGGNSQTTKGRQNLPKEARIMV